MTEQETKDLEVLKAKQREIKINAFDYFVTLARMDETQLMHSGHRKGNAQAIADSLVRYQKDLEKLVKEYIRKYPD